MLDIVNCLLFRSACSICTCFIVPQKHKFAQLAYRTEHVLLVVWRRSVWGWVTSLNGGIIVVWGRSLFSAGLAANHVAGKLEKDEV